MKRNTVQSFTQVPQHQVGFEMDVYDHQDAFTKSYGGNAVTPLTGDLVRDNRVVWQEALMDENSRSASINND